MCFAASSMLMLCALGSDLQKSNTCNSRSTCQLDYTNLVFEVQLHLYLVGIHNLYFALTVDMEWLFQESNKTLSCTIYSTEDSNPIDRRIAVLVSKDDAGTTDKILLFCPLCHVHATLNSQEYDFNLVKNLLYSRAFFFILTNIS